jgi:D-amino peptidase
MKKSSLKILISVDMEGISGVVNWKETGSGNPDYEKFRELMAQDVNAAIEGILDVGEAEVTVCDGHGGMRNMLPEAIHEAAILVRGSPKPFSQISGIDETYDAVMFVGYHSMKGSLHGILSHTYSGGAIESLTVNGEEIGETAFNAGVAGHYGVPLIFVAGDLAVTKEAEALNSDIVTVAVKEAVSRTSAKCIHPVRARAMIRKGAAEAIKKMDSIKPFAFETPIEMLVRYTDALKADGVENMPTAERIDGKTVKFVLGDYLTAHRAFVASVNIASAVSR